MTAWTALTLWPIICIVVYQRTTLPVALCVTILGGYLLLPSITTWDLPLLPALNKTSIPTLTAIVLTVIALTRADQPAPVLKGWLPRSPVVLGLLALLVGGVFGTVLTNQDPLVYGPRFIGGLRPYDGFSMLMNLFIMLAPFFLARKVLATPEGHRILLFALVISALIYTVPILYEVRMSPQIHRMVYGFFPSSFLQAMRSGGYRPSVFLNHGLALGIFLTFALVAAAGLVRVSKAPLRGRWIGAILWLFVILVLAKSLGALAIAICLVPVVLFFSARTQLMVAAVIATTVMTYPTLRALDVVPIERVAAIAGSINPQRAESFIFRVEHEDRLLEKARERPVFGWGIWSRNRVYDDLGRDTSVTDGAWIIQWGIGGWFRYIALFGLMCWPIMGLFLSRSSHIDPLCAALALVLAAKLVDLVPNSGMLPINWMMAGALMGRLEMRLKAGQEVDQGPAAAPVKAGYSKAAAAPGPERPAPGSLYARKFPDSQKSPAAEDRPARTREGSSYKRHKPALGHRR